MTEHDLIRKIRKLNIIRLSESRKEQMWQRVAAETIGRRGFVPLWIPRAALVGSLAVLLLIGSGAIVASAEDSLPGDVLYPVKRSAEKAHLLITRQPEKRAQLKALYDERRVKERQELIDRVERRGKL